MLERYLAVKPFVASPVDDGHTALADLLLKPVIGDLVARAMQFGRTWGRPLSG
jgi:hypothetical protein